LLGPNRYNPFPAAFGPAALQEQVVALVGDTGTDFHRLLPAQTEGLLQLQAHAHMLVAELLQLLASRLPSIVNPMSIPGPRTLSQVRGK